MPRAFFKSQFFKSQNHVLNHLAYLHAQSPLFSGTSNIPLETAQQMVSTFDKPCKWWFVFSLNRTDADRLQIDRGYFQQLLESQKGIWAKAYNIPPERLHIYASYHDLDHHPHVHVVLHGERPSDGFIHCPVGTELGEAFKHCRQTVKSAIANEILEQVKYLVLIIIVVMMLMVIIIILKIIKLDKTLYNLLLTIVIYCITNIKIQ